MRVFPTVAPASKRMDVDSVGRRIVESVKAHRLTVTVHDGRVEGRVFSGGQVVFGPASPDECDAWIYRMIGEVAINAIASERTTAH